MWGKQECYHVSDYPIAVCLLHLSSINHTERSLYYPLPPPHIIEEFCHIRSHIPSLLNTTLNQCIKSLYSTKPAVEHVVVCINEDASMKKDLVTRYVHSFFPFSSLLNIVLTGNLKRIHLRYQPLLLQPRVVISPTWLQQNS